MVLPLWSFLTLCLLKTLLWFCVVTSSTSSTWSLTCVNWGKKIYKLPLNVIKSCVTLNYEKDDSQWWSQLFLYYFSDEGNEEWKEEIETEKVRKKVKYLLSWIVPLNQGSFHRIDRSCRWIFSPILFAIWNLWTTIQLIPWWWTNLVQN